MDSVLSFTLYCSFRLYDLGLIYKVQNSTPKKLKTSKQNTFVGNKSLSFLDLEVLEGFSPSVFPIVVKCYT